VDRRLDRADHLQRPLQDRAGEHQHVLACLQRASRHLPAAPDARAAEVGRWVGGVIAKPAGRHRVSHRLRSEPTLGPQVPRCRAAARHRPGRVVAPLAGAGDIQPHRPAVGHAGAAKGRSEEGDDLADLAGRVGVGPRADDQPGGATGRDQRGAVVELAGQKGVVPAAHQRDRRGRRRDPRAEVSRPPVRVAGIGVVDPCLPEVEPPAGRQPVKPTDRQPSQRGPQVAACQRHR
jgi:hypothetical protein